MQGFKLPDGFKLGAATASLQIEGGDKNNSWYRWCEQGKTKDGTHCIVADDHWNRVQEDVNLMEELNLQCYRMSLEWARIEPQEGHFDSDAIEHYRNEIQLLLDRGIQPIVTLHHFSNPLWLEDSGAWLNHKVIDRFANYADFVVKSLGDLVEDWITINEPNVYLFHGYIEGIWPPGIRESPIQYLKGAKLMILAHQKVYDLIHSIQSGKDRKCRVGVAHHLRVFEPLEGSLISALTSKYYFRRLFEDIFLEGMTKGKLMLPLLGQGSGRNCADFIGVNYYTRDLVRYMGLEVKKGARTNNLGWEIYPEGLFKICQRVYETYKLPIIIAENGTCDARDEFRASFIYDHLHQVAQLILSGVPIEAYCHWTLLDNFEWAEGLEARFGLIEVDYQTQERKLRNSARFYAKICAEKGATEATLAEFLSDSSAGPE